MKRDVTVIQTRAGDPCPTVVDSNRVVGAGLHYGPSVGGNFYGQGQRQNPLQGFKSWGGNLGANNLGYKGGFDLGVPIGSKVLDARNSGCQQSSPISGNSGVQTFPAQPVQPMQPVQPPPNPNPPDPFGGSGLPTPPPIPGESGFNSGGNRNPFDNSGTSVGNKILVNRQSQGK